MAHLRQHGAALPASYLHFMAVTGRRLDGFLTGSDFEFDKLAWLREGADELLIESGLPAITPHGFAFAMHQGYQFYYLLEGRVYYYHEGWHHVEERFESFERFFESMVEMERRWRESRLPPPRPARPGFDQRNGSCH